MLYQLALFINFSYLYTQFNIIQPLHTFTGRVTRSEYISKYRPEYPVIEYANSHLAKNSRILCVSLGNRGYYFDINHLFDLRNGSSLLCNINKRESDTKHKYSNNSKASTLPILSSDMIYGRIGQSIIFHRLGLFVTLSSKTTSLKDYITMVTMYCLQFCPKIHQPLSH